MKQTIKDRNRLFAIVNGTYRKPYTPEELYSLIENCAAPNLVVLFFNIIHRLNLNAEKVK